ncbi:MAG: hypothetical protein DRQ40_08180, partial [Gammaproteobacteria bacterium]
KSKPNQEAEDQIYAALDAEILKRQGLEAELKVFNDNEAAMNTTLVEYEDNLQKLEDENDKLTIELEQANDKCKCPCHKEGLWKKVPELEAELDQVYGKMEYIMWKLNTHTAVGETIQAWFDSEGKAIRGVK